MTWIMSGASVEICMIVKWWIWVYYGMETKSIKHVYCVGLWNIGTKGMCSCQDVCVMRNRDAILLYNFFVWNLSGNITISLNCKLCKYIVSPESSHFFKSFHRYNIFLGFDNTFHTSYVKHSTYKHTLLILHRNIRPRPRITFC